jgi:hypothetical protein
MSWKRYPIRAAKQIAYFYIFFILLYAAIHVASGQSLTATPDFSTLFTPRLLVGLALLGACYPLVGFSSASEPLPEGGWEKHGQPLREVMSQSGYRPAKREGGRLVFRARSPMRRALTMFEDDVTLAMAADGTLLISGLRKEVARIRLRVKDYARRAANGQPTEDSKL